MRQSAAVATCHGFACLTGNILELRFFADARDQQCARTLSGLETGLAVL
jgi:hypothetical protein